MSTTDTKYSYCVQQHVHITDPEDRKKVLMKAGRCFVCLRKQHLSRDCYSTMKCPRCNGRHHGGVSRGCSSAFVVLDDAAWFVLPSAEALLELLGWLFMVFLEVHYIPHHAVIREDEAMTKRCIVYDVSAKRNGPLPLTQVWPKHTWYHSPISNPSNRFGSRHWKGISDNPFRNTTNMSSGSFGLARDFHCEIR